MVVLSVPFFFPLVFCLSLQCTPHCSLVEGTCNCQIKPLLLSLGSVSLGFIRICFMVVFPLKGTCIPYLPHMCLILSAVPLVYGMTICPMVFLVVVLLDVGLVRLLLVVVVPLFSSLVLLLIFVALVSSWLLLRTLFCTLLMAQ